MMVVLVHSCLFTLIDPGSCCCLSSGTTSTGGTSRARRRQLRPPRLPDSWGAWCPAAGECYAIPGGYPRPRGGACDGGSYLPPVRAWPEVHGRSLHWGVDDAGVVRLHGRDSGAVVVVVVAVAAAVVAVVGGVGVGARACPRRRPRGWDWWGVLCEARGTFGPERNWACPNVARACPP